MAQVLERVQEMLNPAEIMPRVIGRYSSLHIDHGKGIYVWDVNGERYADFTSGIAVVNTGHCHPRVVAAIQEQAARIIHAQANILAHSPMLRAAKLLTETTAPNLNQVFWTNSGAEATEGAIKLAKVATGRPAIIAFRHGVPRPHARGDGGDVVPGEGARALRAADSQRLLTRRSPICSAARTRALPEDADLYYFAELEALFDQMVMPDDVAGDPGRDRRRRGRLSLPDQALAARWCASCATGTASCSSWTRSSPAWVAPGRCGPTSTSTSCRTS